LPQGEHFWKDFLSRRQVLGGASRRQQSLLEQAAECGRQVPDDASEALGDVPRTKSIREAIFMVCMEFENQARFCPLLARGKPRD
jgi:hypothetical protein